MKSKKKKNSNKSKEFSNLKNLDPKWAGIDIGANSIFVCALDSSGMQEVREFPVFTQDLLNMANWLEERDVESIAMESTGVYWIPVFEILEEQGFEVYLVNAFHLKCVPGRKTDVKDCQWIQRLHSNGLLQGSFRPIDEYVRLRGIVRQRSALFEEGARQIQHMHKALTQMNIQLRIAISDITGKTGLAIITAIIKGERDPKKLAAFRDFRCKNEVSEIVKALNGNWRDEHIFVLKQSYEAYEFFHKQIEECELKIKTIVDSLSPAEISPALASESNKFIPPSSPFDQFTPMTEQVPPRKPKRKPKKKSSYDRSPYFFQVDSPLEKICGVDVTEIPGIEGNIAMVLLSETGTDMSKWKNKKYFSSWLCLCPGNKVSGGKILNSRTRPSNNRAAQAFRLAANAVGKTDTAIGAYYRRMRSKFGPAKAITATAHKLAVIYYTMLKYKKRYKELGAEYYEKRYRERSLANLQKKAKAMGYQITPLVTAA